MGTIACLAAAAPNRAHQRPLGLAAELALAAPFVAGFLALQAIDMPV